jgi:hypothetical protein
MTPHHINLKCDNCRCIMPHEVYESWADGICVKCETINPINERTWPMAQACRKVEQEKRV